MISHLFLSLALALYSSSSPLHSQLREDQEIQLPTGRYTGAHNDNTAVSIYYAIPFAFASRFEAPRAIEIKPGINPDDVVNTSTHGPSCINFNLPPPYDKGFSFLLGTKPIEPQSEDCLNLDIYVPDGNHQNLPVYFFTPGGGFLVGASFPYDMTDLISRAVAMGKPFIGVVINYRLGPLGFLNPSTWDQLNIGLLDQVEALRWVKKYISRFGGSPDKVTISGQSAGAESALEQLLFTDESEDLFRSAWIMSIPSSGAPFLSTAPTSKDDLVKSYAKACGCPKHESVEEAVNCLRTTDVSIMTNESAAWEGSMTSLGGFVRSNVFELIRAGKHPRVPMWLSTTRDEGTLQALGFQPNNTETTAILIQGAIAGRGLKGQKATQFLSQMLEAYPNDPTLGCPYDGKDTNYGQGSQYKRMSAIATDLTYTEAWVEYLETFSATTAVWGLEWGQPIYGAPRALGAAHGSDLVYYFPSLLGPDLDPRAHGNGKLMAVLQEALINFVNHGNPNGCATEFAETSKYRWPSYAEEGKITVLNASNLGVAAHPPHRPGFDIIHGSLRPGPL